MSKTTPRPAVVVSNFKTNKNYLCVDKNYQGKGYAKQLIDVAKEYASNGVTRYNLVWKK